MLDPLKTKEIPKGTVKLIKKHSATIAQKLEAVATLNKLTLLILLPIRFIFALGKLYASFSVGPLRAAELITDTIKLGKLYL